MIFNVSLTAGSIAEISEARLHGAALVLQKSLAELVQAHGIVRFGSFEEAQRFIEYVRGSTLSTAERRLWQELLIELKKSSRMISKVPPSQIDLASIDDVSFLDQLRDRSSDHLFVVASAHLRSLFPANDLDVETPSSRVNVATAAGAHRSEVVLRRQELAALGVHPSGYSRDAVWTELFDPITRLAGEIVIVDRYIFKQIILRHGQGIRDDEHLIWFLKRVSESAARGVRVTLIGGALNNPKIAEAQAVLDTMIARWQPAGGTISELRVFLAKGEFPHNRHIRFVGSSGTGIGLGFDLFEGLDRMKNATLWDVDGLKWQYQWRKPALDLMRAKEQRIMNAQTTDVAAATL